MCRGVLEDVKTTDFHSSSNMYPDVAPAMKKLKLFIKIFVFVSVIIEGILILINIITYKNVKWSFICGIVLAYACFTVIYTLRRDKSHRTKLFMQSVGGMLMLYLLDVIIGYHGWSLNYAIPCIIMSIDGTIMILMLANRRHWQSYILLQLMMLLVSVVFVILAACKIIEHPILTIIAAGVSGFLLIGTIIFGDRKAVGELTRRFRI